MQNVWSNPPLFTPAFVRGIPSSLCRVHGQRRSCRENDARRRCMA
jgi:hypothetical protein